jgi:hypothetical protein
VRKGGQGILIECAISENQDFGVGIGDNAFHELVRCTITQNRGPGVRVARDGHVRIQDCTITGGRRPLCTNPAILALGARPALLGGVPARSMRARLTGGVSRSRREFAG